MIKGLEQYGNEKFIEKIYKKKPVFICTIATTDTSKIKGISGAGANEELNMYTPAADVEIMTFGHPKSMSEIPETVVDGDAAPTPSMLTKASLELGKIPLKIVDAGCEIKPELECERFSEVHGGDIRTGKGVSNPKEIYEKALEYGKKLSKNYDYLVIGESIAGGTTTALGVLKALGYDAEYKVSGSMPENPHQLKLDTVNEGLKNSGIKPGKNLNCFDAISAVGDPMIPAVVGMTLGSEVPVVLAGGTQMAAVCAVIKSIKPDFDFSNICLATTIFVARDETADFFNIMNQIDENVSINIVDPQFETSTHGGLKNYIIGFVKEGAGAGGAMFTALMQGETIEDVLKKIEKVCK